jgi:intracellular sulfur oxidation DsrE/DsrF family protein
MINQKFSDEFLNSYIDDQLDLDEKMQAFAHFRQEESLQTKICELRTLKEAVQHAYQNPPAYTPSNVRPQRIWKLPIHSLAACLLLLAGGLSGWFTHARVTKDHSPVVTAMPKTIQHSDAVAESRKVIVHVSNANPMKLKAALDETEGLLNTYLHEQRDIQVELITNKHGVDLMRSNVTSYEKRILSMQEKYPNLKFLVCGKTIAKLQTQGKSTSLLPHTSIATSAADQINMRLKQGWGYIRI